MAEVGDEQDSAHARWLGRIERAERAMEPWRTRARKIVERYRDERAAEASERRYALLWANVETVGPAIYAQAPTPVVASRWKDGDPVTRLAAECLERCLAFLVEQSDLDGVLDLVKLDWQLSGRGTAWVRYSARLEGTPTAEEVEAADGQAERLTGETIEVDHVAWEDFGHGPGRTWREVEFVWRRVFLSREQLVERFGEDRGKQIKLDHRSEGMGEAEPAEKACIYEVWDKVGRQTLWLSRSGPKEFLDERSEMYRLGGFFPCPMPLYATLGNDRLIPVPDFVYYQDQAEEIDQLTGRIAKLSEALKMAGVYAGEEKEALGRLLQRGVENTLVPVESWAAWADKGGVKGLIEWLPVDMVIQVLTGCYEARRQLIEDVYQITGISDIVRGASDPRETLGAQRLKGQWGALRIRDRQAEMQRFARDIVRIMGELVAEHFGPDTLAAMSGMKLPTRQELAMREQAAALQAQQAAMVAAQTGQALPPPPQPAPEPTWEDVVERLRDDPARRFSMEIETDSTIAADEDAEKARRTEFVTAVGGLLQQSLPVVQAAPEAAPMIGEMLRFVTRGFRAGRQLEDAIEKFVEAAVARAAQPPQPPQPSPKEQADIERDRAKVQIEATNAETKRMQVTGDLTMGERGQAIEVAAMAGEAAARPPVMGAEIQ